MSPAKLFLPIFGLSVALTLVVNGQGRSPNQRNASKLVDPVSVGSGKADVALKPGIAEAYGKLPLSFEANQGQTDPRVKFLSRGRGYSLFLTPSEAVLVLRKAATQAVLRHPSATLSESHPRMAGREPSPGNDNGVTLRMKLVGANPHPRAVGQSELPGKANYFIGNDAKKWHTNVPTYAQVELPDVYPGVDLVYYGNQQQLENDFIVAPGADPSSITIGFDGIEKLFLDAEGNLLLASKDGEVRFQKPLVYQELDGARREIPGGYVLKTNHQIGFHVAAYDARRPLIIDPVLSYSTYLGGSGEDFGFAIAVDGAGNAYVTGCTDSTNFPTTAGAFQTTVHTPLCFGFSAASAAGDAFVTKLNPTGSGLVYSTYLGGSSRDSGVGIAVDANGNAYVTGQTNSPDFPTTPGAFQTSFVQAGGCSSVCPCPHAFVTKLNPNGSGLVYSTYLGGSHADSGSGIAIDAAGNAYIAGATQSSDFPTTAGAFQPTGLGVGGFCAPSDAFVTKVNPSGTGLVYSTYLGSPNTGAGAVAVDSSGDAYVTGSTSSSSFPTTPGAFQTTFGGGSFNAFVTKLNPAGSGLAYSTYLDGSDNNGAGRGIAIDSLGNAYVTGQTASANFPTTPGAFQTSFGGGVLDAFVTKVNPLGTGLVYSTYLGGSGQDQGQGIAVDSRGSAYVAGFTSSTNFPTANPVQAANGGGGGDAFVTKVNLTGSALDYSTYLGGNGFDAGNGIAVDNLPNPNAYVAGQTASTNFPTTTGAFQTTFGGGTSDAFVTKIAPSPTTTAVTSSANPSLVGQSITFTAIVSSSGGTPTGAVTFSDGTNTLGTVTLTSGQATFSTSSLLVGSHSITATYNGDTNFSPSTGSLGQNVTYGVCALYDQTRSVKSGAVYPIKVALCDVNGTDVSSSAVVLHATGVTMASAVVGTPQSPGNANPDSDFRFDSTLGTTGGYIFNLSTSGLASGTYSLQFTATGDPVTHSVNFGVN